MTKKEIEETLDERQLSDILGISVKTCQAWRGKGRGPVWYRLGERMVRYKMSDVTAFLDGGRVDAVLGR